MRLKRVVGHLCMQEDHGMHCIKNIQWPSQITMRLKLVDVFAGIPQMFANKWRLANAVGD